MDDLLLVDDYQLPLLRSCHQLCHRLRCQSACGAERILVQRGLHGENTRAGDSTGTAGQVSGRAPGDLERAARLPADGEVSRNERASRLVQTRRRLAPHVR